MAEVASAVIAATTLLLKVTNLLSGESPSAKRVKKQIKLLEGELEWMRLYVKEADEEGKSHEQFNLFAKQMREIIFDAEDVIDEFILGIVHDKWYQKGSSDIFNTSFLLDMGNQIQNIYERVEKLKSKEKNKITVDDTEDSNRDSVLSMLQRVKKRRAEIFKEIRQQEPVQMYEGSARQVIDLLLDNSQKLRIISITGMGGVGKTTLSQKVFNDKNVVDTFKYRAFVYISKKYDLRDSLQCIMKSCGSVNSDGEVTSQKVHEHLGKEKYLIVLDDIWDTKAWEELSVAFGSRVLLTTRHKNVAAEACKSSMNPNDIHDLSTINDKNESWELFRQSYLQFNPDNLKQLGEELVEKCHGLPLAIVVLGDHLSIQVKEHCPAQYLHEVWSKEKRFSSWLSIQGDDSHKCSGILALSYDYLPYYLKPCFLYTSMFPKAMKNLLPKVTEGIRATKLFQFWIAEGFIQNRRAAETLEETAERYLGELISRNLIQVSKWRCDGRVSTCCINGILHRISDSESYEDGFSQTYGCVDEFNRKQNSHSHRRVAVDSKKQNKKYLSAKFHDPRIRSLLCHEDVHFPKKESSMFFFLGFKSLRVLDFFGYTTGIDSLPKEVGELIHLRYLSLGKTKLKRINTRHLRKLVNLQTLYLKGDINHNLVLDDRIWCLDQLRHLYLINIQLPATVNKFGINNLEELQLLFIRAGDWINVAGLENLSSLIRKLKIEECLSSHSDNTSKVVASLTELRSLALISKTSSERLLIANSKKLADKALPLAPSTFSSNDNLNCLHLKGHIIKWAGDFSFPPNLCKLKLEGCSWNVEDPMPILENLPFLRFLRLGLESYQGNKLVCSRGGFASLQTLELVSILSLEEWTIEDGALASLAKLKICDCKNLEKIPNGLRQLTTLKELRVANMPLQFQNRMVQGGEDWNKIQHIYNRVPLA